MRISKSRIGTRAGQQFESAVREQQDKKSFHRFRHRLRANGDGIELPVGHVVYEKEFVAVGRPDGMGAEILGNQK